MNSSSDSSKKFKITAMVLFIVILAAALAAIVYYDRPASAESGSLHIDLVASPAYVKAGFEAMYVNIENPETERWDVVLPPNHGAIFPGELTGTGSPRRFLSPFDEKNGEYTILIPFELDEKLLEQILAEPQEVPGIFLAGIGDHWEIYLNGELVISELRDARIGGNISFHLSRRNVSARLDRDLLKSGTNIFIIRIIGPPSGRATGLNYSGPYYIGAYTGIVQQRASVITMIFCTTFIFVGLYHLLMYFMRSSDKYNMAYGFFSIAVAVYYFSRSAAIYGLFENSGITERIEFGSLYILPFLLAAFIELLNFGRLLRAAKIFGVFSALLIILQSVFSVQFANDLLRVFQSGGIVMLLYVLIHDVGMTFASRVNNKFERREDKRTRRRGIFWRELRGTSLGNIFITIVCVAATAIFDVMDSAFFHIGIALTRYSFFLFTISSAFILAQEYSSSFNLASQMNELLEATVFERTAELEEQVRIAEHASHAKSDFLANMSHEIRTPINAIVGMTNIGKTAPDIEKKDYCFGKIDEASTHLLGVINDILDMSKIEADRLELSEIPYDFSGTIERVADVIAFKAEEKRQEFAVKIDEKIPKFLIGDDQRLAQVVTNLLSNAVKFTPESGSIELKATLDSADGDDCTIRVEVSDNGIGISPEQQAKLFVSFQQADSGTSRNYGGTGLGLAISKRIIELMNGEVWIDSELGKGSIFGFSFPAKSTETLEHAGKDDAVEMVEGEFSAYTALLADDIEINREILMSILETTGISIEAAENGQEALIMFNNKPGFFDVILMDVQMPVMDGYTATRNIRSLGRSDAETIPIIAMTANVFKEDIEKCLESGMNEHIGKPVSPPDLIRVLRKYLKAR
ncbi:MAG: response regulator [Oscillospiraceae bacterium]|nr:response regulator [Oscillospiraceae bacterium]